jgi:hypothetical protein
VLLRVGDTAPFGLRLTDFQRRLAPEKCSWALRSSRITLKMLGGSGISLGKFHQFSRSLFSRNLESMGFHLCGIIPRHGRKFKVSE